MKKIFDPEGKHVLIFSIADFDRARNLIGIDKESWDKAPIVIDPVFGEAKEIQCSII